jgi:hypothetical protein
VAAGPDPAFARSSGAKPSSPRRDDLIDACACAVAARDSDARLGGDEVDSRGFADADKLLSTAKGLCSQTARRANQQILSSPDSKNIPLSLLLKSTL